MPLRALARVNLAAIERNVAAVHLPMLWIAGSLDPTQINSKNLFQRADNPKNRHITLPANHMETSLISGEPIISWLSTRERP